MNFHRRKVSAAELVRNFAHWREVGSRELVMVTHHGRETHVFMGLEEFDGLKRADGAPLPIDRVQELAGRICQGLICCSSDYTVEYTNGVALAMTKSWDRPVNGRLLWDALPELAGTLTEAHIRHSLDSGEASAADIPSPFRSDAWLHVETFPFAAGVALLLRDITAEMQRNRLPDIKAAMLKAMAVHGRVGYVRVSSRGFIDYVDEAFCSMIGLPDGRMENMSVADLIELPCRPAFREQLERVLRGDGDRRLSTRLLTNAGTAFPIDAALARLSGVYGLEGAVIIATPASDRDNAENKR